MKKLLYILLMVSVILPGLSCDWVLGTGKAQAAFASIENFYQQNTLGPQVPKVRLLKDCTKVQFKKSSFNITVPKPNPAKKFVFEIVSQIRAFFSQESGSKNALIQFADWPDPAETKPGILHTTLRLRE